MNNITKILFVCHGNICRSPMAEAILKELIKPTKLQNIEISSRATSREAIGEDVYYKAKETLENHGIYNFHHISTQITSQDYEHFDKIYVMDDNNLHNIKHLLNGDNLHKIEKLLEEQDIEDPWYTRDFEKAYMDIRKGCERIIKEISKQTFV